MQVCEAVWQCFRLMIEGSWAAFGTGAYTADRFTSLCRQLQITQSMGRVGSCFDNAAAEAFFSSLQWEVLRDAEFRGLEHAQAVVQDWCYGFYNHVRRHSHNLQLSPVNFEALAA